MFVGTFRLAKYLVKSVCCTHTRKDFHHHYLYIVELLHKAPDILTRERTEDTYSETKTKSISKTRWYRWDVFKDFAVHLFFYRAPCLFSRSIIWLKIRTEGGERDKRGKRELKKTSIKHLHREVPINSLSGGSAPPHSSRGNQQAHCMLNMSSLYI